MNSIKSVKPYLKRKQTGRFAKPAGGAIKATLQYAAIPITLASAFLYLLGRTYYENYLSYWGLSESLFPLSKDGLIIAGFIRVMIYSLTSLSALTSLLLAMVVLMFVIFISTYRPLVEHLQSIPSRFKGRAVAALKKNVIITDLHDSLVTGITCFVFLILLVPTITLLLFPCRWVADQAKEYAKKEHQDILSGKPSTKPFPSRATLHVTNPAKGFDTYSGHLIQTSATHCALYDKGRGVMIFPLASVVRMTIAENKADASRSTDGKE